MVHRSTQVRQRRLELLRDSATVRAKFLRSQGQNTFKSDDGLQEVWWQQVLVALDNDVIRHLVETQAWSQAPFKVVFIGSLFAATIASLIFFYQAHTKQGRGIFATLTGIGLVLLGCQDSVYRKTSQWYLSHYYYGRAAALLLIFSLAILQSIYQDKTNRWRTLHIVLNCFSLLLFFWQGFTGAQSLPEVPLSWQEPYVQRLYELKCSQKPCTVQPAASPVAPYCFQEIFYPFLSFSSPILAKSEG